MMKLQNSEETQKTILIKKYSNRRLYDVTHSHYLTLEEIVALIRKGFEVQVLDSKSKEDITQSVLTQIFLEKGKNGTYLFSTSFLHQLIRNRDGILGEFFADFVPKLLEMYLETRDSMRKQLIHLTSPKNWLAITKKDFRVPHLFFNTEEQKQQASAVVQHETELQQKQTSPANSLRKSNPTFKENVVEEQMLQKKITILQNQLKKMTY